MIALDKSVSALNIFRSNRKLIYYEVSMLLGQIIKDQSQNSSQIVKTIINFRPKPTIKFSFSMIIKVTDHHTKDIKITSAFRHDSLK